MYKVCCFAFAPEGVKAEKEFEANGTLPDPSSTDNPEFKIVLGQIRDGLKQDPKKWNKVNEKLRGVSEVCWLQPPGLLVYSCHFTRVH